MSRVLTISRLIPGPTVRNVRYRTSRPIPEMGKTTYIYKNLPDPGGDFEENEYLPRRLSYWPPGLKQYLPRQIGKPWDKVKGHITLYPPEEENKSEYTEEAEYPPISDYEVMSVLSKEKKRRLDWYEKIREMPSAVQKLSEIVGVDRQHCLLISAWSKVYNYIDQYQNMTRSNVIHGLPKIYDEIDVSDISSNVRHAILDAVALSYGQSTDKNVGREKRPMFEHIPVHLKPNTHRIEGLLMDIANIAIKAAVNHAPHLAESQADFTPEVASFWYLHKMDKPRTSLFYSSPGDHMSFSNTCVQFRDLSVVNIRTQEPLEAIVDQEDPVVNTLSYTPTKRNPARDGHALDRRRLLMHAGYWPGSEQHDFPFLSIYPLHVLKLREYIVGQELPDIDSAITAMGMMFSFGWCNSLAFNHGFTPYDELDYPFSTQTICTDGQTWNFTAYQLNTHRFHGDFEEPTKNNVCWTSGSLKLFERIEDGKLVGVNDTVINLLLKFMLRKPSQSYEKVYKLRPYIREDLRTEEVKAKEEFEVKRRFGQALCKREMIWLRQAKTLPIDWIIAERNPHAPPHCHMRRIPKCLGRLKRDRGKLTI